MSQLDKDDAGPLAEFTALRQEMDRRSTAQQGVLVLHITAAGTIASLVLRDPHKVLLLLVVPLASFAFCCLYLDNAFQILRNAKYITEKLSPRVPGGLHWEEWQRKTPPRPGHVITWRVSLFTIFPTVAFTALAWSAPRSLGGSRGTAAAVHAGLATTWALGLAATVAMTWLLISLVYSRSDPTDSPAGS